MKTQYDQKEKRLSEMIMTHWTNFAKTGDPNFSKRSSQNEWKTNNVRWPKYNVANRAYLDLNLTSRQKFNYRTDKCKFWNAELPQRIEEKRQKDAEQSKPSYSSLPAMPKDPAPPWIDREPIFSLPTLTPDDPAMTRSGEFPDEPNPGEEPSAEPSDKTTQEENVQASSSVVVSLIIIIGILFLLVNICAFGGIYYQRDKLRVRERLFNNRFRCNGANTSRNFDDDDDGDIRDVYMKAETEPEMVNAHRGFEKNRTYDRVPLASIKPEAIGGKRLQDKWAEMSRQRSSSTMTMDPHTRVKEWINTEIIQRYSPKILRRQRREEKKRHLVCAEDPPMTSEKAGNVTDVRTEKSRNKVSVAIDATPAARTMSVLKQTPIELTKSMDAMGFSERVEIKPSLSLSSINKKSLTRSDALVESDDMLSSQDTLHKSSTSIQLKPASKEKRPAIKVTHGYSKSEPAQDISKEPLYSQVCKPEKTPAGLSKNTSFDSSSHYEDINVTSKEYAVSGSGSGGSGDCFSDGESVRRIKYPKVLPDFPAQCISASERRLSLPPPLVSIPEGSAKIPPPPPPRISSTLGRKKSTVKTESTTVMTIPFHKPQHPDAIPEEHKSPVVPCVPNKVCPAVTAQTPSAKRPAEPRIVIKANSVPHHQQHQNPVQQKQPKRTNIPRVVHPQNNDRNRAGPEAGDTGTVKRKKK